MFLITNELNITSLLAVWLAKCNIGGRQVKRSFAVSVHGFDGARQKAIEARKVLLQLKCDIEKGMGANAPKSSNQYHQFE